MKKNIIIVGLGLIGGSLAKALVKYTHHNIIGIDIDESVCNNALKQGAIHKIGTQDDLTDVDIIYLCIYPSAAVEYIKANAHLIPSSCIVTDTSGIKTWICKELGDISKQFGFTFIGSHPMAGKEKNGFDVSDENLFLGASYIIVPGDVNCKKIESLEEIAATIGFSMIIKTTPEEHDKMIAFTSQLPHVLACSYVMSPCCLNHKGFSAGSYRDVSRVAHINEVLWAELFLDNREPLIKELDLLIENITSIQNAIHDNDKDNLLALLKKGREIKEYLGE